MVSVVLAMAMTMGETHSRVSIVIGVVTIAITLLAQFGLGVWWAASLSVQMASFTARLSVVEQALAVESLSKANQEGRLARMEEQIHALAAATEKVDKHLTVIETYLYTESRDAKRRSGNY